MKNEKGFSLIELLIVVAIIGIIAAIAIPNLLASRRAANEASAISGIRTISTSNETYRSTLGGGVNFSTALGPVATAGTLAAEGLVDNVLGASATPNKSGFVYNLNRTTFVASTSTPATFNAWAYPASTGALGTGSRSFASLESHVVHQRTGQSTAATDFFDATTRAATAGTVALD